MQVYKLTGYRANENGLKIEELPRLQVHGAAVDQRSGLAGAEGSQENRATWIQVESWLPCGHSASWLMHQERSRRDLEGSSFTSQTPSREENSV